MIDTIINNVIVDELTRFLQDYTEKLKENLVSADKLATGELHQSIVFEVSGQVGIVSMREYGEWVDKGRSPGKFPPPPAIRNWVETKGLTLTDSTADIETQRDQLTYLIGRKISTEGIEPTNFIEDPDVIQLETRIADRVESEIKDYIESL